MSHHTDGDLDDAVEDLQAATETLGEPIDDLTEQMAELTARMSDVADGMAAFDRTRRQLGRVSSGSHAGAKARTAGD